MKKRILCVMLSLIMLVSLVPAAALTASAAGLSTSESAITVLKQLEGYSKYCKNGYTGYGTLCTKTGDHADHITSEKEADAALRAELKDLDKAVNSFSGSLSQSQHDALVLFSFQNGTAWTTGTGAFQNAVKNGLRGSDFLSAICRWNETTADDDRRKIEANIYLNGVYNTKVPSRYITVRYDANGGKMSEFEYQYYDVNENPVANIVPTRQYHHFMGWYNKADGGHQVTSLEYGRTLYAHWQAYVDEPGGAQNVDYTKELSSKTRLYAYKDNQFVKSDYYVKGNVMIDSEYIDNENVRWARVTNALKVYKKSSKVSEDLYTDLSSITGSNCWINLGEADFGSSTGGGTKYTTDVTVTVTNTYVRVRSEDSIYSKELRQAKYGEQLRIVNTSSSDGFLWGQIADSNDDGVCEGWVALIYTNYEEVRGQAGTPTSYKVIATATIVKPVNGYVNVRSEAGTNNKIVGALPYQARVDIYEITYVNGIQWGRYSGGWFCLAYADVVGIDLDDYTDNTGVLAYAFIGDLKDTWSVYEQPDSNASLVRTKDTFKPNNLTITNLTADDNGVTWGKIPEGWVKVTNADGTVADVTLDIAKFYTVVDGVTVRTAPSASADRVNNLVKGVEFNVNDDSTGKKQVMVIGDTIWGYADKVGEDQETYRGWINLASKYVARGDAPAAGSNKNDDNPTGEMATIVGADKVNVRIHHDIYSKVLGKMARGTTAAVLGYYDGWYKLDYDVDNNSETDSWVNAKYVEITKASSGTPGTDNGSTGSGSVETGLGVIANTYSGVNVRTGAGTGYPMTGKLLPGTMVEILEVTTKGASKWGRVKEGWICMDYVTMVNNYEITNPTNPTNPGTTSTSEVAIYTGTIASASVEIHKTPSLKADVVRTVVYGDPITMHEIVTVVDEETTTSTDGSTGSTTTTVKTTSYWARVNDGYIEKPAENLNLDTLDEATYTVTGSDTLNVRNNPGTSGSSIIYKLEKGDQVVVTKLQIINCNVWGFIEADAVKKVTKDEEGNETVETWNGEGWISLAYCTKGAVSVQSQTTPDPDPTPNPEIGAGSDNGGFVTNTTGYRYTGKVINTASLNVRATASQSASLTTTLKNGAALVVYETTISEGMAWGRCDAGWVYLYYVDLTPVVNGAVDARVVYNENTIAYTDMNCSAVAGTYSRMAVIDIYEIVGKMARTDLGWVNTDNLL